MSGKCITIIMSKYCSSSGIYELEALEGDQRKDRKSVTEREIVNVSHVKVTSDPVIGHSWKNIQWNNRGFPIVCIQIQDFVLGENHFQV